MPLLQFHSKYQSSRVRFGVLLNPFYCDQYTVETVFQYTVKTVLVVALIAIFCNLCYAVGKLKKMSKIQKKKHIIL